MSQATCCKRNKNIFIFGKSEAFMNSKFNFAPLIRVLLQNSNFKDAEDLPKSTDGCI